MPSLWLRVEFDCGNVKLMSAFFFVDVNAKKLPMAGHAQ